MTADERLAVLQDRAAQAHCQARYSRTHYYELIDELLACVAWLDAEIRATGHAGLAAFRVQPEEPRV